MVVGSGAMAYKMGKSQTQQIEQASGIPIEEMTDEEIQEYVQKYNIPVEPVSASDQAAISAADDTEEFYDEQPDYTEELTKLASLRDQGILTDEEFEAKKKQILGL